MIPLKQFVTYIQKDTQSKKIKPLKKKEDTNETKHIIVSQPKNENISPNTEQQTEEIWTGQEGVCSDWAVTWSMTKQRGGSYSGRGAQVHNGGSCVSGTGRRLTSTVQASISGNDVTANSEISDGNSCQYRGTLNGNQVTGTQNCPNVHDAPWEMTIPRTRN